MVGNAAWQWVAAAATAATALVGAVVCLRRRCQKWRRQKWRRYQRTAKTEQVILRKLPEEADSMFHSATAAVQMKSACATFPEQDGVRASLPPSAVGNNARCAKEADGAEDVYGL